MIGLPRRERINMTRILSLIALLILNASSAPAANLIERACLKAGRTGATRELCGCIQRVANQSLGKSDQRLAASFFKKPHKAQVIRQSDRASHEAFWTRYKKWSASAKETCGAPRK